MKVEKYLVLEGNEIKSLAQEKPEKGDICLVTFDIPDLFISERPVPKVAIQFEMPIKSLPKSFLSEEFLVALEEKAEQEMGMELSVEYITTLI